jgi:hypothetical protein
MNSASIDPLKITLCRHIGTVGNTKYKINTKIDQY